MNIREKILAIQKQISKSKGFDVKDPTTFFLTAFPQADDKYLQKLQKKIGYNFPKSLYNLYLEIMGFSISWKYNDPHKHQTIRGRLEIPHPELFIEKKTSGFNYDDASKTFVNLPFYPDFLSEEMKENFKSFFILDTIGYGYYTLLQLEDSSEKLFLYVYPDKIYEMTIDLEQYFEIALATRGMNVWQQYFLKDTSPFIDDNLINNLEMLFPAALPYFEKHTTKLLVPVTKPYFFEKIEANILKIQKIKGKIRINNWNEPVPVLALYKTQSILGEALTPEIIEIYKYTNGYELNWQIPSLLLEGEINIMPLEYMMAGKNGYFKSNWNTFLNYESITWHKHFTPVEMELVKGLRPFELLSLTPYIASLKDNEPQQIYFLDHTVLNLLLFDTKTYLEKALRYMGSTYWHFFEKEDFRIGDNQLLKDNLTKIENILNSNA